ncbi:helix-turn-helix transcriptional regulator [Vogesella indigofera]|uniref:helix-turn-helix transcriptional regulator n=1 Tax=Vogesella indigofera TaxID=45465 RepID=UPI00234F60B5|nr:AlpA family transcriptional regulator [Vogesella indigofera]MDC7698340.1 AlpA family transcriptional regulator [Vogesella indigofera]
MKVLRLKQVMAMTGLARSTLYKYMVTEAFPPQVKLGARAVGWLEAEVLTWLEARIQERA